MAAGLALKNFCSKLPLSKSSSYGDLPRETANVSLLLNIRGYHPFELTCANSLDTIKSIGMSILTKGFYTDHRGLLLNGRESIPEHSYPIHGADSECAVNLSLNISELASITLRTISGKEVSLSLGRSRDCRVKDIKKKISEEGGTSIDDQIISFQGSELDDYFLLNKLKKAECTLHLRVKKASKIRAKPLEGGRLIDLNIEVTPNLPMSKSEPIESSKKDVSSIMPTEFGSIPRPPLSSPKHFIFNAGPERFSNLSTEKLISSVSDGLRSGHSPKLTSEGSGGCYFMPDSSGKANLAVFKPIDEEPLAVNCPRELSSSLVGEGLKKGTQVGGGAIREVAAYFLDYPSDSNGERVKGVKSKQGYSGVPPTAMVECFHEGFHYSSPLSPSPFDDREGKVGSLQQFVPSVSNCEDMGPSSFPASEVHKIAVLDMRLANTDRNGANILVNIFPGVGGDKQVNLTPIDHGYCFPSTFEDCTFEWLYWPQSTVPFSSSTLRYISSLDSSEDIELLDQLGFSLNKQQAHVLHASTLLLKKGAMAGLTPFDIGSMMVRQNFDEESVVERMLRLVESDVSEQDNEVVFLQRLSLALDSEVVLALASKNLDLTVRKSIAYV